MSQYLFTELEYVQKYGNPGQVRELLKRHNYPKNFLFTLEQLGLVKGSQGEATIWHLEDDWIVENIQVKSFTGGAAAGDTAVITLADDNHFKKNGINLSYPLVRDEIEFPISRVKAVITAKTEHATNNHTITIKPIDDTVVLNTEIVANMTLAIVGNSWAEGSKGSKPRSTSENRVENYYQIFQANYSATGTSMTLAAPFRTVEHGPETVLVARNTMNTEIRHDRDISNTLLIGTKSKAESALSDHLGHNVPVYRTGGAFDEAIKQGFEYKYANSTFGLDEIDDANAYLDGERINVDTCLFFMGNTLISRAENTLMEFGATQNGVFNYAMDKFQAQDGFSAEDFFTWIGFRGIHKGGRNFLFKALEDFNDPKGLGSAGYDYKESGLIVPFGTLSGKGKKVSVPSMGAEYRQLGSYSRRKETVHTGGANIITATEALDAKSWDFRSEIGGKWTLVGQWIAVRPS